MRAALIAAARRLFIERGYADTGTPAIVAAAGVTRGALYHHFKDKRDLFRAVVEAEARAVAADIERTARSAAAPVQALSEGGNAFYKAMAVAGRTRLLLIDAPAVLGRAELDDIDARHGARTLRHGLRSAMTAGAIRRLPIQALTTLLSALFDRGALAIEGGVPSSEVRRVTTALLDGLAPPAKDQR